MGGHPQGMEQGFGLLLGKSEPFIRDGGGQVWINRGEADLIISFFHHVYIAISFKVDGLKGSDGLVILQVRLSIKGEELVIVSDYAVEALLVKGRLSLPEDTVAVGEQVLGQVEGLGGVEGRAPKEQEEQEVSFFHGRRGMKGFITNLLIFCK